LAGMLQSKRFAQAIFEIASESNQMDQWSHDLKRIASLAQNEDLVAVLENPKYAFENKKKLLNNKTLGVNPLAVNLAYILTSRGHFHLVSEVFSEYQQLVDDNRGIAKAEIITAVPLDEEEKRKLGERLSAITNKKVVLVEKVDPQIIGGMIARVDGKIIDGSTRTQLDALKSHLARASI
jgi:F-type H+-transporting ATPase subunit delta